MPLGADPSAKFYPNAGQALLLVVVALTLQVAAGATAFSITSLSLGDATAAKDAMRNAWILLPVILVADGLTLALGLRATREPVLQFYRLRRFAPGLLPAVVLTSVGLAVVLVETDNCILQLIMFVTGSDKPPPDLLDMSRSPIGAAILVIVVAPLLEEYLFRGLILRGLLTHHRRIVAVGIAALAFGIAHGNVRQFFLAVIIGLAFGWWYVRTRSVGPGIIGHATFNAVAWGAAQLGDVSRALGMHRDQGPVVHEPWWLTLGGLALVALGIWSFHRDAPAGGPASFPLPLPSSAVEPPLLPEPPLLGPPQATGAVRAAAPAS